MQVSILFTLLYKLALLKENFHRSIAMMARFHVDTELSVAPLGNNCVILESTTILMHLTFSVNFAILIEESQHVKT